ncbi:hypothetical protein DF105_01015 [Burkholderia stagnalis]|uniref:hypothetical protein n=1 Tax=Burkholderia stagnalis TaxID=1503054 RepID=UPI000F5FDEBD|nr:hypothetical protein [Burkholderia stagnalis]RQZ08913.1 hypothetical protein DF105_01015 [Burkholderia stagnalis]
MLEWLKRLVARRELAELDALRREARLLEHARAENRHLRESLDARGVRQPFVVPPALTLPRDAPPDWLDTFAREWRAASHETTHIEFLASGGAPRDESHPCHDGGIDYRFLGMTGEEES